MIIICNNTYKLSQYLLLLIVINIYFLTLKIFQIYTFKYIFDEIKKIVLCKH